MKINNKLLVLNDSFFHQVLYIIMCIFFSVALLQLQKHCHNTCMSLQKQNTNLSATGYLQWIQRFITTFQLQARGPLWRSHLHQGTHAPTFQSFRLNSIKLNSSQYPRMFIHVCIGAKFSPINMWSIITFHSKIKRHGTFFKSSSYLVNYINFLFEHYAFLTVERN